MWRHLFHFRSHKGQKDHYKAKSWKVAKKPFQGSKFDVILRKKLFRNTPDVIKSGQFRKQRYNIQKSEWWVQKFDIRSKE